MKFNHCIHKFISKKKKKKVKLKKKKKINKMFKEFNQLFNNNKENKDY